MAVKLALSVTVQTTVLSPTAKVTGALLVVLCTPQLSCVTGVSKITPEAVQSPASVVVVTVLGQTIVGAVTSLTVMVAVQVEAALWLSVTVSVTVVVPPE